MIKACLPSKLFVLTLAVATLSWFMFPSFKTWIRCQLCEPTCMPAQSPLPLRPANVLDFSQIGLGCGNTNEVLCKMGVLGFNHAPELLSVIAHLKQAYGLEAALETGTFQGNTSSTLGLLFDPVHSIEVVPENYEKSKKSLEDRKNIHLHLGDSGKDLPEILKTLQDKKLLLYFDAHWHNHWPIREEIQALAPAHKDRCVIIIDDVQVPGCDDIPFDTYQGKPLNYDFIKDTLPGVFSDPQVFYLIPYRGLNRGKMVIIPGQKLGAG